MIGTISRRTFLALLSGGLSILPMAHRAHAYRDCEINNFGRELCHVGIRSYDFRHVGAYQETMVWCWAAVLQMIFAWHGRQVSQKHLVTQTYGAAIPTTIDPLRLLRATNRGYYDDYREPFSVRSRIFSADLGVSQLNNCDIIGSLRNERPLVICNQSHMMVLIGVRYYPEVSCQLRNIDAAWVADPYPHQFWAEDMGPGFRDLPPLDLVPRPIGKLRFLADLWVV